MVTLLEPGANSITTLEGQNTNCADVFYAWVVIAWQLERVLGNESMGLTHRRHDVVKIYNACFDQMMTESSHFVFLVSYFLHPCESQFVLRIQFGIPC